MQLTPGAKIGPYEIISLIGAGGMGEVYRARDPKLNRDVAIKILPDVFTADPDRLSRFKREAQVLASLNHPNIGQIYGFEDSGDVHALVLELVDGPTLADRIAVGALPFDEAFSIAREIADALECAHEIGVVHRDLKPANIKVRPDGTVKVLDFGLAKAFDQTTGSSPDMMNSPTMTSRGTMMGIIIGTAAYMPPEQARGRAVDRRADIWAFGVVLFEMLTGKRAFDGEDISITLASVLKDDLNWHALPGDVPRPVRRLLRRCLEKDPKKRLSSIGDARLELDEAVAPEEHTPAAAPPTHEARWRRALPWAVAAAASIAAAAMLIAWAPWRAAVATPAIRLSAEVGIESASSLGGSVAPMAVISPDGRMVAFVALSGGRTILRLRRLDQLQATVLDDTEGAHGPFFSPDGQWIGFFALGKLKKVATNGGAAITLCDASNGRGAAWDQNGIIVFQPAAGPNTPLFQVPSAGGAPTQLGTLTGGETTQRWPQILPGGKSILYSSNDGTANWERANVKVIPREGGEAKLLVPGAFHARYLPSGHLVYVSKGTLFAVPFDADRLELAGTPAPVLEGIGANVTTGAAQFSVSETGTLVYVPGSNTGRESPIHQMDEKGATTLLRAETADWFQPRFSPDGKKLAITIAGSGAPDIWIHEPARDLTKFTFHEGRDIQPVWTPDGRRIAFSSDRAGGTPNLFWQRADGTGEAQRLTTSTNLQLPGAFHPSGRYLAFWERHPATDSDLLLLPIEGDEQTGWRPGKPEVFLATPAIEMAPAFSPDGRWIAYMSNESGVMEIYVRPFQGAQGKWKISTAGGIFPAWSRVRNELFYVAPSSSYRIMAAAFSAADGSFRAEAPRQWSPNPIMQHAGDRPYDLHPDGRRVVMLKPIDQTPATRDRAIFIFGFFDELRRLTTSK